MSEVRPERRQPSVDLFRPERDPDDRRHDEDGDEHSRDADDRYQQEHRERIGSPVRGMAAGVRGSSHGMAQDTLGPRSVR